MYNFIHMHIYNLYAITKCVECSYLHSLIFLNIDSFSSSPHPAIHCHHCSLSQQILHCSANVHNCYSFTG